MKIGSIQAACQSRGELGCDCFLLVEAGKETREEGRVIRGLCTQLICETDWKRIRNQRCGSLSTERLAMPLVVHHAVRCTWITDFTKAADHMTKLCSS